MRKRKRNTSMRSHAIYANLALPSMISYFMKTQLQGHVCFQQFAERIYDYSRIGFGGPNDSRVVIDLRE